MTRTRRYSVAPHSSLSHPQAASGRNSWSVLPSFHMTISNVAQRGPRATNDKEHHSRHRTESPEAHWAPGLWPPDVLVVEVQHPTRRVWSHPRLLSNGEYADPSSQKLLRRLSYVDCIAPYRNFGGGESWKWSGNSRRTSCRVHGRR